MRRFFLRIIPYSGRGIYLVKGTLELPYVDVFANPDIPTRKLTKVIQLAVKRKYHITGVILAIKICNNFLICYFDASEDLFLKMVPLINVSRTTDILDEMQRNAVEELDPTILPYTEALYSPWEAHGWLAFIIPWLNMQLNNRNEVLLDFPVQVKGAWPRSTVLQVISNQSIYYLKWSYSMPPFEYKVIQLLASIRPNVVPKVIAYDISKNMFIMKEFGTIKKVDFDMEVRFKAAQIFSDIQIAAIPYVSQLQSWGCLFLDSKILYSKFDSLLQDESLFLYGLSESDLLRMDAVANLIMRDCDELSKSILPVTLNNEDFQDGNIAINEGNIIIYDWTNTFLAHPFFSYHYYLFRYRSDICMSKGDCSGKYESEQLLIEHYLNPWRKYVQLNKQIIKDWDITSRLFWVIEAIKCEREREYVLSNTEWYCNISGHIVEAIRTLYSIYERIDK